MSKLAQSTPTPRSVAQTLLTPRSRTYLKETEDMHTCSLCLKLFDHPKILPCFHSFCCKCLKVYTEKNCHNNKFACPLCALECHVPTGGIEELQTNFYIKAAQTKSSIAANTPCEVCEEGLRAEKSCLECEQNMCPNCSRAHLKMTSSRDHHLVSLTDRGQAGEGQVTSKSFCDKHKGDELVFYCRKCKIPICLRCKVTSHEQHTSEDLSDVAAETRILLNDMLKGAQTWLPTIHTQLNDITTYGDELETEREKLTRDIKQQAKSLHEEIDTLSKKLLDDVQDEFLVEMARLNMRRKMISDKATSFSMQLHSANEVVSYGSDADITRNKEKLVDQLDKMSKSKPPADLIKLSMEFLPASPSDQEGFNDMFGQLNKTRNRDVVVKVPIRWFLQKPSDQDLQFFMQRLGISGFSRVEEFASFSVDSSFKAISCVCPTSEASAWIALGWTADAHHFYRHGTKIKSHVVSKTIDFIAMDSEGTLYMTSNEQKVVGKPGPGFNLEAFASFPGYHPRGLFVTADDDILVCLAESPAFQDYRPNHKNKVVKLNASGRMIAEYGADGNMFMYPLRVAINVNGDICVSDSKKLCLIILKPTGELKCSYSGPGLANLKNNFEPRGIACDALGHIMVADSANNCIHMLDHQGKLLQLLVTEKQGLFGPYSVVMDKDDYLWVGCRDAEVKVYKISWH